MEMMLKSNDFQALQEVAVFAQSKGIHTQTNNLCLKTIGELLELQEPFFVDSYQRGYKWETQQVTDLLEDIYNFVSKNNSFYCLQPVVVKHKDNQWELIDGQQRLTTIYIILSFLHKERYKMNYRTRKESANFLETISEAKGYSDFNIYIKDKVKKDNIDNYYFFNAFVTIEKWFQKIPVKDVENFHENLLYHTKIIWYHVDNDVDSRQVFARLNSGKIPLTNAELIKALFLQGSNTNNLLQTEIAQEWDRIEQSLQNDDFWFFLNSNKNQTPTRIEFVFDLITEKEKAEKADAYYSFRKFLEVKEALQDKWKDVKSVFATLQEWFEDRELYHYVGFLLNFSKKVLDLISESKNKPKSEFKFYLKDLIKKEVNLQIDELEYPKNSLHIRKILLLFNVQTVLASNNIQNRFDFNKFKNESWDIEHIHATASETPKENIEQEKWLNEMIDFIDDIEKEKVKELLTFEEKYKRILECIEYEDTDNISNLTLLDYKTNREYKNAHFPIKRQIIISKDKNGTFILPCTKNIFLKYYTDSKNLKNSSWNENDRSAYTEAIKTVLNDFLPTQNN